MRFPKARIAIAMIVMVLTAFLFLGSASSAKTLQMPTKGLPAVCYDEAGTDCHPATPGMGYCMSIEGINYRVIADKHMMDPKVRQKGWEKYPNLFNIPTFAYSVDADMVWKHPEWAKNPMWFNEPEVIEAEFRSSVNNGARHIGEVLLDAATKAKAFPNDPAAQKGLKDLADVSPDKAIAWANKIINLAKEKKIELPGDNLVSTEAGSGTTCETALLCAGKRPGTFYICGCAGGCANCIRVKVVSQ